MLPFPHSRVLSQHDWMHYPEALRDTVGACFDLRRPQSPARKIEYITALGAIHAYFDASPILTAVDVGGDGSPYAEMSYQALGIRPTVVDPADGGRDLHRYLQDAPRLAQILTCLSVIEHVPVVELPQFLRDLDTLLAPGGVLVLTCDYAPGELGDVADRFHFHWMRERIFTAETLHRDVLRPLLQRGLQPLGPVDFQRAVPPWVYDYAFASLALIKPRRI